MKTRFVEEQVTIKGNAILKGTLAIPEIVQNKLPAVLIINGSGAANRDGNIKIPPIKFKNAQCPIIAITGDKDVQANPEDLKAIENLGKVNIKCMIIKNMDHTLKEFTGEKTVLGAVKQYKKEISQSVHPQLKAALGEWLTKFM